MTTVDFEGERFDVMHVVDPNLAVVSLADAVQGCAQIVNGTLVASLAADGSAVVSERTIARVAQKAGYGLGFAAATRG